MLRASVIVPAHDAEPTLARTLEGLRGQRVSFEYEVLVVDNGSRDRTAEIAAAAGEPVRVVSKEYGGPATARNRGVAETAGAALAFCDADCYPADGWLAAGVEALKEADLVQGRVTPELGVPVGPFDRTLWVTHEVGLWETANLFVSRPMFERVGGFEDWLIPETGRAFGEDVLFGWRAKRLGARSAFCAEALAHHAVFPRSPAEYVAERTRLRHFPELAARVPELRDAFFFSRLFLDSRTAAFDAAFAAAVTAAFLRRPFPLLATLPYLHALRTRARRGGGPAPLVAAVDLAADAVGAAALVRGSIESGTPLL